VTGPSAAIELRTNKERNQECVMGSEVGTYVALSS
jgi:hypothetical protein